MKNKNVFLVFKTIFILTLFAILVLLIHNSQSFHNEKDYIIIGEGSHAFINGEKYIPCGIRFKKTGKTLTKIDGFTVMEIQEDKEHNFVFVKSFMDHWTFVKESYNIPKNGELTVAYIDYEQITKGNKWKLIKSIQKKDFKGSFRIKTKDIADIFNATSPIYFGYNDCPVGTDRIGYMGIINERLIFIKANEIYSENLEYTCHILKEEYKSLYNSYLVH